MNLPPIVYSLNFWKTLSYFAAGILAVLVATGKLPPESALTPAAILAGILAFLNAIGIVPEMKARAVLKEYERLLLDNKAAREARSKLSK